MNGFYMPRPTSGQMMRMRVIGERYHDGDPAAVLAWVWSVMSIGLATTLDEALDQALTVLCLGDFSDSPSRIARGAVDAALYGTLADRYTPREGDTRWHHATLAVSADGEIILTYPSSVDTPSLGV